MAFGATSMFYQYTNVIQLGFNEVIDITTFNTHIPILLNVDIMVGIHFPT